MINLKNINLAELKELRDKNELLLYFKIKGITITEEDILELKELFNKIKNDENCLTLQQLDEIAGGGTTYVRKRLLHSGYEIKGRFNGDNDRYKLQNSFFARLFRIGGEEVTPDTLKSELKNDSTQNRLAQVFKNYDREVRVNGFDNKPDGTRLTINDLILHNRDYLISSEVSDGRKVVTGLEDFAKDTTYLLVGSGSSANEKSPLLSQSGNEHGRKEKSPNNSGSNSANRHDEHLVQFDGVRWTDTGEYRENNSSAEQINHDQAVNKGDLHDSNDRPVDHGTNGKNHPSEITETRQKPSDRRPNTQEGAPPSETDKSTGPSNEHERIYGDLSLINIPAAVTENVANGVGRIRNDQPGVSSESLNKVDDFQRNVAAEPVVPSAPPADNGTSAAAAELVDNDGVGSPADTQNSQIEIRVNDHEHNSAAEPVVPSAPPLTEPLIEYQELNISQGVNPDMGENNINVSQIGSPSIGSTVDTQNSQIERRLELEHDSAAEPSAPTEDSAASAAAATEEVIAKSKDSIISNFVREFCLESMTICDDKFTIVTKDGEKVEPSAAANLMKKLVEKFDLKEKTSVEINGVEYTYWGKNEEGEIVFSKIEKVNYGNTNMQLIDQNGVPKHELVCCIPTSAESARIESVDPITNRIVCYSYVYPTNCKVDGLRDRKMVFDATNNSSILSFNIETKKVDYVCKPAVQMIASEIRRENLAVGSEIDLFGAKFTYARKTDDGRIVISYPDEDGEFFEYEDLTTSAVSAKPPEPAAAEPEEAPAELTTAKVPDAKKEPAAPAAAEVLRPEEKPSEQAIAAATTEGAESPGIRQEAIALMGDENFSVELTGKTSLHINVKIFGQQLQWSIDRSEFKTLSDGSKCLKIEKTVWHRPTVLDVDENLTEECTTEKIVKTQIELNLVYYNDDLNNLLITFDGTVLGMAEGAQKAICDKMRNVETGESITEGGAEFKRYSEYFGYDRCTDLTFGDSCETFCDLKKETHVMEIENERLRNLEPNVLRSGEDMKMIGDYCLVRSDNKKGYLVLSVCHDENRNIIELNNICSSEKVQPSDAANLVKGLVERFNLEVGNIVKINDVEYTYWGKTHENKIVISYQVESGNLKIKTEDDEKVEPTAAANLVKELVEKFDLKEKTSVEINGVEYTYWGKNAEGEIVFSKIEKVNYGDTNMQLIDQNGVTRHELAYFVHVGAEFAQIESVNPDADQIVCYSYIYPTNYGDELLRDRKIVVNATNNINILSFNIKTKKVNYVYTPALQMFADKIRKDKLVVGSEIDLFGAKFTYAGKTHDGKIVISYTNEKDNLIMRTETGEFVENKDLTTSADSAKPPEPAATVAAAVTAKQGEKSISSEPAADTENLNKSQIDPSTSASARAAESPEPAAAKVPGPGKEPSEQTIAAAAVAAAVTAKQGKSQIDLSTSASARAAESPEPAVAEVPEPKKNPSEQTIIAATVAAAAETEGKPAKPVTVTEVLEKAAKEIVEFIRKNKLEPGNKIPVNAAAKEAAKEIVKFIRKNKLKPGNKIPVNGVNLTYGGQNEENRDLIIYTDENGREHFRTIILAEPMENSEAQQGNKGKGDPTAHVKLPKPVFTIYDLNGRKRKK